MFRYLFVLAFLVHGISSHAQSKGDDLFNLAKTQLDAGETDKAVKTFLSSRTAHLKEQNYYRAFVSTQSAVIIYQDTGDGVAAEKLILETISAIPNKSNEELEIHASLQDNLGYTYLYVLNQPEDALKSYQQSVELYKKAGLENTSKHAFELVNCAITYFNLYQFNACIRDIKLSISIFEKDEETAPETIAEYYRTMASAYNELGDYQNALTSFQSGLKLVVNRSLYEIEAKLLNDIGSVYMKMGDYKSSLYNFNKAKTINGLQFGKDAEHYALNVVNIGSLYKETGDLDAAMKNFQEALTIYQQTPPQETTHLIDVMILISGITDDYGLVEESQKLLDEAMKLAVTTYGENSIVQADVYTSFAVACFGRAEFDQSLNYNFKALSILNTNKYPESEFHAMIHNNVGQAYDELNNVELALQYKKQALELYKKMKGNEHPSVAMATGNIGLSYEISEDYDRAIDFLKQSVALRLKIQDVEDNIGTDYLNIGLMYLKKNDATSGIEYLDKARIIYDRYAKNIKKAMIYNRLAHGYEMLNDQVKSKQYTQKAIIANTLNFSNESFDANPDKPDFLSYYELNVSYTAKVGWYTKQNDQASLMKGVALLGACDKILKEKAIDLKNAKDRLELAQLNGFFTEAGMLLTDKLYHVTKDQTVLEKAFYYSERSKANELFADIKASRASAVSGIPKKTSEKRTTLIKRMNTLQQQIATAYDSKNQELITKLKSQEFDLNKQFDALQTEINLASPDYGSVTNQRALPAWKDIQKTLDDKTAIVTYTITDSAKYILIGTQSKLILKRIPPKTNLDRLVRGYINQIKFQASSLKEIGERLTEILWTPVESALAETGPIEKIIIIPEGSLTYLPFESLGKEDYLLNKYTIRYHYSAALMLNAGLAKEKNKPSVIAMAPVFEDKETNFVNKSCQRFVESASKMDSTSRAFTLNGEYISPLPATEVEVQKINQLHSDKGILSKHFLKEAANEELVKKGELATYDYIHFATHGFVNTDYPELSGLLLSQDATSTEDGILYSGEILGLKLKANLVTLSACETALGKKIEGEGIRGLSTSFLFAGAKNVVASLWKVADESTSILMITFYNELLSGKDKSTALRIAKQRLIQEGKYSHPYYWAPFIQIGAN